jgi:hypothetical protein
MLRQDDWRKSHLVTFGWNAGKKYGGHLGSCIIMSVIMNRVKLGWGTVEEILNKFPQTAANPDIPKDVPQIWSPEFIRLLHEIESIYDGSKDYSNGAVYFCDTAEPVSEWFQEKVLNEKEAHRCVGNMNSLMYFK